MAKHTPLYQWTRDNGTTMRYLAQQSGIAEQQLTQNSRRKRGPTLRNAVRLAQAMNVSLDQLADILGVK